MKHFVASKLNLLIGVVAFLGVAVSAGASLAGGIVYHNELKYPVLVQGTSVINGVTVRGPQILILPGKKAYDGNLPTGFRFVNVYDGNLPSHKLHQNQFQIYYQGGPFDVHYNITPSVLPLNKVDIVPKKN